MRRRRSGGTSQPDPRDPADRGDPRDPANPLDRTQRGPERPPSPIAANPLFVGELVTPGPLRAFEPDDDGSLQLDFERASGEIAVAADGSVRIRLVASGALPPPIGPSLGRDPWPLASLDARRRGGTITAASGGAEGRPTIRIEEDPFAVSVLDPEGAPIAELVDFRVGPGPRGGGTASLLSPPGERLFGFGEKSGALDRRGREMLLRNRDADLQLGGDALYVSIPFFLAHDPRRQTSPAAKTSAKGVHTATGAGSARGVFLESPGAVHFDAAARSDDRVAMRCAFGPLEIVVHPGPTPAEVLRRFTALTGRSPLPPRWAIGHHQSRWSYGSERAVRKLARSLRRHRIPCDAVHLDIEYMRGYRVFTWHERRFPDPARMIAALGEQGLRAVPIVDPGVKVDDEYAVYREGQERDFFCRTQAGEPFTTRVWPGTAALPDFNRAEVRAWWSQLHAPLLDAGAAGIWNDMNEPAGWERSIALGKVFLPLGTRDVSSLTQRSITDEKESTAHEAVRNVYGLQMCRATRRALEQAHPGDRAFVLSRSGYAGIGRHAAVWTGDSRSRWPDLRESVRMLLGLSVSGVAFCGADIGGFAGSASPELFARWMQIGALYPFARTHSMWLGRRQEAWRFGARVEGIAREALELRMRLLPYLYSLFHEAEASGAPVWRPLFYAFPNDPEVAAVEDQLMIGPWLMAAPVLERGSSERELVLPPGVWIDWHDDARYVGPRRLRVAAPLERLPLFLRGGAPLPTQSAVQHTGEVPAEPLVVHVAPGADGEHELVEDDGATLDYRARQVGGRGGSDGAARTPLRVRDRSSGRLRLEIGRRSGAFDVAPRTIRVCFRGCGRPSAVLLDGERVGEIAAEAASPSRLPAYRYSTGRVDVWLADSGRVHCIEVEPAP